MIPESLVESYSMPAMHGRQEFRKVYFSACYSFADEDYATKENTCQDLES